jgi:hypothetical protein
MVSHTVGDLQYPPEQSTWFSVLEQRQIAELTNLVAQNSRRQTEEFWVHHVEAMRLELRPSLAGRKPRIVHRKASGNPPWANEATMCAASVRVAVEFVLCGSGGLR